MATAAITVGTEIAVITMVGTGGAETGDTITDKCNLETPPVTRRLFPRAEPLSLPVVDLDLAGMSVGIGIGLAR